MSLLGKAGFPPPVLVTILGEWSPFLPVVKSFTYEEEGR